LLRLIEAGDSVQAPGIGNRYPQARCGFEITRSDWLCVQKFGRGTEEIFYLN
jgi:hypothetical protein